MIEKSTVDVSERQMARLRLLKDIFHIVGHEWEEAYGDKEPVGDEVDWPSFPTMIGRGEAEGAFTREEVEMARKMAGLPNKE